MPTLYSLPKKLTTFTKNIDGNNYNPLIVYLSPFQPQVSKSVQNFLLIWLDTNINETHQDFQSCLQELRKTVVTLKTFTNVNVCIDYLKTVDEEKIFLITSGSLGQQIVPLIHALPQIDTIFIFCQNVDFHRLWAKDWSKIEGVYCTITSICNLLKKSTRIYEHYHMSMSFVPKTILAVTQEQADENYLDQLDPSYMYFFLFKETILEIDEDTNEALQEFIIYCREKQIPESQLKEIQNNYNDKSPIWWYTEDFFLHSMLNKALRSLDTRTMIRLSFFIRSLHLELEELYEQQSNDYNNTFITYRGEALTQQEFQHLVDTEGGITSFNNFLSTTKNRETAIGFATSAMKKSEDTVGIVFVMTIDPSKISKSTTPFAAIDNISAFPSEEEILFTMHTVFRVGAINIVENDSRLYEVQLTITDVRGQQLASLTHRLQQELVGEGLYRLAQLIFRLGHFSQAAELYEQLLKKASNAKDKANLYYRLGETSFSQGKYTQAYSNFIISLEIFHKSVPENDFSLAALYNDIGLVLNAIGEYSKALPFLQKALKIKETKLNAYHTDLAESYLSIGIVYCVTGDYSTALLFHEQAHNIYKITLPQNHPDLALSYHLIGRVYQQMRDYPRALQFYQAAHKIYRKALPPNHPTLAFSNSVIGEVYESMNNDFNETDFYGETHSTHKKALPSYHSLLDISYGKIGEFYPQTIQYAMPLESYKEKYRISPYVLSSSFATWMHYYHHIINVYHVIDNYPPFFFPYH